MKAKALVMALDLWLVGFGVNFNINQPRPAQGPAKKEESLLLTRRYKQWRPGLLG
jgi:hypothetical protein